MSARACTSIQRIDGSTAIRAMSRWTGIAPRCRPMPGISEPGVSSTMRGPCRPSSGSSSSARATIAGAVTPPPLWPTTTISSAALARAISTRRCAPASMQRSQHDGSPRAYSSRYGQWLLICTTKNLSASGRSSLKQTERRDNADDHAERERRAGKPHRQPTDQPAAQAGRARATRPASSGTSSAPGRIDARRGRCGTACR